jgi:capsular exopolysaccharide synthesis family protein
VAKPLSGFVGAFRNLRTSLLLSRADASAKVIAITSSLPDEGKTTTAICLARTMALAGDKVLVIDCDLRKRALCKFLNAEPEIGLIEVLAGAAELEEAIRLDALTGAAILPLAKSAETTKDVLGGPAMDRLLAEARTQYDVVILDTAPVLPVAETRALAAKADVVALLVRWRKTPRKAAASSIKLLQQAGDIYIAGSALTLIDAREHARYGYGDPGYYVRADSRAYVSLGSR